MEQEFSESTICRVEINEAKAFPIKTTQKLKIKINFIKTARGQLKLNHMCTDGPAIKGVCVAE
jgi:plasmid maintenance system killer protein